jgi:hypothetical protein
MDSKFFRAHELGIHLEIVGCDQSHQKGAEQ